MFRLTNRVKSVGMDPVSWFEDRSTSNSAEKGINVRNESGIDPTSWLSDKSRRRMLLGKFKLWRFPESWLCDARSASRFVIASIDDGRLPVRALYAIVRVRKEVNCVSADGNVPWKLLKRMFKR